MAFLSLRHYSTLTLLLHLQSPSKFHCILFLFILTWFSLEWMFNSWPWGEYLSSLILPEREWELNNMEGKRKVEIFTFAGKKVTVTYWDSPLVLYSPWTDNSCKSVNPHRMMFLPALWLGCFNQIPQHPYKKYIGDFQLQGSAWQLQILQKFLQVPLTQALAPTVPSACHVLTTVLQLELYCCSPPALHGFFWFSDAQISTSNPIAPSILVPGCPLSTQISKHLGFPLPLLLLS